jgi:hypothetical protein
VPSPAHQATPRRTGHPTGGATPNPHPTVNVRLTTADWGFSGIDPAQMEAFEKALARAQDTLGTNEPRIRHALEALDLDTSHLAVLRETRQWIADKRPDLRRRHEAVQAVRERWSPGAVPATGLAPFDEGRYARAAGDPDAYAAALALGRTAHSGEIDRTVLAELERRAGDADFATALMHALGATGFRTVLATTGKGTDRAAAQRLQAALGKALAAASPRLDAAWRAELTAKGSEGQHYWLSRALMHGTYDAAFLLDVARKIEAANRVPVLDPLPGVLTALSRVPAAAQDFFAQPGVLDRLMNERRALDDGKALSAALLAATTVFRDHAGSADNPSRGYLSAKLASQVIHLEAQRLDRGRSLRISPEALSQIFASYIRDVNRVAAAGADAKPGVAGEDHALLPGREDWGARFDREELHAVMKEVFQADPKAFAMVSGAQTIWARMLLGASAAELADGRGSVAFKAAARELGAGFGFITSAAGVATIAAGKELDERQNNAVKIVIALVNSGLSIPQHAGWPIVAGTTSSWTGVIENALETEASTEKAVRKANGTAAEIEFLVHQLAAQSLLDHGLFGSADPPAKTHPWASLSDLRPGDDPRKAPNNFLKEDGTTLLTRAEMLASRDADGNPVAYDAYRRWLYEGLAGKTWSEVEAALSSGYQKGFRKFQ